MSQVIQFDDRYAHKKGILIPENWFQDALEIFRQIFTFSKNLLECIDYFSIFGYNRIESKICRNRGVVYDGVYQTAHGYSAILLTGPRQAGKTTMLRELAEKEKIGRQYVTLDDLTERDMAKNDPALFLQLHKPPVLIDEVQYAPELFTYIKIYVDEHHHPGDFWMTGSQIFRLMRGVQESLAGRVALLHMSPLSQREIIGAPCVPFTTDLDRLLAQRDQMQPVSTPELFARLWRGSMPGLVSGQTPDRNVFYSSYLSTYMERDVRDLSGSVDALKFNRFVTAVAARTSQLLNYNALAEDADIDIQTSKAWINILETLGIIFLLHPYSNNVLKRTIKTPKVYSMIPAWSAISRAGPPRKWLKAEP